MPVLCCFSPFALVFVQLQQFVQCGFSFLLSQLVIHVNNSISFGLKSTAGKGCDQFIQDGH